MKRASSVEEYISLRGEWQDSLLLLKKSENIVLLSWPIWKRRPQKVIPMILEGLSMNEKYKK